MLTFLKFSHQEKYINGSLFTILLKKEKMCWNKNSFMEILMDDVNIGMIIQIFDI